MQAEDPGELSLGPACSILSRHAAARRGVVLRDVSRLRACAGPGGRLCGSESRSIERSSGVRAPMTESMVHRCAGFGIAFGEGQRRRYGAEGEIRNGSASFPRAPEELGAAGRPQEVIAVANEAPQRASRWRQGPKARRPAGQASLAQASAMRVSASRSSDSALA